MDVVGLMGSDSTVLIVAAVGIITEVAKRFGVPSQYLALMSCVLGVVAGLAMISLTVRAAIVGLVFGAATSGLYDLTKTLKSGSTVAATPK